MANMDSANTRLPRTAKGQFLLAAFLLIAILGFLFGRSFLPGVVHFANDTPVGFMKQFADNGVSDCLGRWGNRNVLGGPMMAPLPDVSNILLWSLGEVGYGKFYAPIALLLTGLCAWLFFRQLELAPLACILGALAAALNSDFLATACWGVASQPIAFGMCYLALAAIVSKSPRSMWIRLALAGMAVGIGVMEAADIGAIFSVFVAAFVLYHALTTGREVSPKRPSPDAPGNAPGIPSAADSLQKRFLFGSLKVAVVALFAGWMAFGVMKELIGTQIQGVAGMETSAAAKAARWSWATQWSMPKREILEVAVPGIFGFRMDTLGGGVYWGAGGRDPAWDRYFESGQQGPKPGGFIRYGGGGLYAGILVVLVGAWAAAQSLRKQSSVFSPASRKLLWFWLGVMLVSLLLAFGRYAPFYWVLYQLPGVSVIRNPAKFMHVFTWALVVLFAYGVHGLTRCYLEAAPDPASAPPGTGPKDRGSSAKTRSRPVTRLSSFDRKWILGCLAAIGLSLVGWLIYASSRASLETYLQTVEFGPDLAKDIAGFSIGRAGWFVVLLAVATGLMALALKGAFTGARAKWGGIWLGLFLILDLGLANQPWIIHLDYTQKYPTNPVIDQLRQQPYEHRVAMLPKWISPAFRASPELARAESYLEQTYIIDWAQQQFQYYNVQSLDIVQMPRVPADLENFERALQFVGTQETLHLVTRRWQLTNTRYLVGAAPFLDVLNQGLDGGRQRFRVAARFDFAPRDPSRGPGPDDVVISTNGMYALFDFTGALPRAKLYANWQVTTNDQATLKELASISFDPEQTVLVAKPDSSTLNSQSLQPSTNSLTFVSYTPKDIVLQANAAAPSVLLLNDKYDPNWKVSVDGKPETLLRCNYIMRGVRVPAGEHRIEFRYAPPVTGLYVSISALAAGVMLLGCLLFTKSARPSREPVVTSPSEKANA